MFRSSGVTIFCTWALVIFALDVSALPVEDEQRPDPVISLMEQTATNHDEVPDPRGFDLDVGASALPTCAGEDLRARPQKEWCNWDPARRTPQECGKYFVTKGKAPPFKHLQCKFMDGNCITGEECTLQADTSPTPSPSPTPAPSASLTPTPSPLPTPSPSASPTPAPSPSPTSVSDTPAPASTSRFGEAGSKPNIILYLVDDWPYELWPGDAHHNKKDFNGQDNNYEQLFPNISKVLVNEGMEIRNMYSHLYCSPSRRALLTGRYYHSMGASTGKCTSVPTTWTTYADQLKTGGYSTHFLGKWQLGFASTAVRPTSRGFDTALGFESQQVEPYGFSIRSLCSGKKIRCTTKDDYIYDLIVNDTVVTKDHPLIASADGKIRYQIDPGTATKYGYPDAIRASRLQLLQRNSAKDQADLLAQKQDEMGRTYNQDAFNDDMVRVIDNPSTKPFFIWMSTSAVHAPLDSRAHHREHTFNVRKEKFKEEARCPWFSNWATGVNLTKDGLVITSADVGKTVSIKGDELKIDGVKRTVVWGDAGHHDCVGRIKSVSEEAWVRRSDGSWGHGRFQLQDGQECENGANPGWGKIWPSRSSLPSSCIPGICDEFARDRRFEVESMAVAVDESLGLAEKHLRANGKWDNTLILFMSDNGGALNKDNPNTPMKAGKFSNMEGGVHVRAAMGGGYLPQQLHGKKSNAVMHFVDFWPTFSYLAGLGDPYAIKTGDQGVAIDGKNVALSWRKMYTSTMDGTTDNEFIADSTKHLGRPGTRVIIHSTGQWNRGRAFSYVTKDHVWKVYGDGTGMPGNRGQCANYGGRCVWDDLPLGGTKLDGCTSTSPCIFDVSSDDWAGKSEDTLLRLDSPGVPPELRAISVTAFSENAEPSVRLWHRTTDQENKITVNGTDCLKNQCNGYGPFTLNKQEDCWQQNTDCLNYEESCFNGA